MKNIDSLRVELSINAKNGVDFISAAILCWSLVYLVWTLDFNDKTLAVFTFFATMPLLPVAFLFSKIFKTKWKTENNPIEPLGLWFNFAQLFYFPIIFIILYLNPRLMPIMLGIITGAHFFPYSWFYKNLAYAIIGGIISFGLMVLHFLHFSINVSLLFIIGSLLILALWLFLDYKRKLRL